MELGKIKEKVIRTLEIVGVAIDESEEDVCLLDYDISSLTFIAFVVELEKEFSIKIPDEYFNMDLLVSLIGICNMLDVLINEDIEELNYTR